MARTLTLVLTFSLFVLGCTRDTNGNSTRLIIQAPDAYGKVGTLAFPTDRKACYGVNVTAPDLSSLAASACAPEVGVFAGFVAAGDQIGLSINRGSARKIDLYVLLKAAGDNSTCPKAANFFDKSYLQSLYLVGAAADINLTEPEQTVTINANFPGLANHVAATLAAPATCLPVASGPTNAPGFHLSAGQLELSGGSFKMKARAGVIPGAQVLSGGDFILKVK